MTVRDAIKILEEHNKWRKGAEVSMVHPTIITEAIDIVTQELKGVLFYDND